MWIDHHLGSGTKELERNERNTANLHTQNGPARGAADRGQRVAQAFRALGQDQEPQGHQP